MTQEIYYIGHDTQPEVTAQRAHAAKSPTVDPPLAPWRCQP